MKDCVGESRSVKHTKEATKNGFQMSRLYSNCSANTVFLMLTMSVLIVQTHGLFDITMRFMTFIDKKMYDNDFYDYYVNRDNVPSPMACISLCKKDDSCMTATFNLTSEACSFSAMPSLHEGVREQQFETSPGVNSYAKFRYRGMY